VNVFLPLCLILVDLFRCIRPKLFKKSIVRPTWGSSAYTPVSETTPSQAHAGCTPVARPTFHGGNLSPRSASSNPQAYPAEFVGSNLSTGENPVNSCKEKNPL